MRLYSKANLTLAAELTASTSSTALSRKRELSFVAACRHFGLDPWSEEASAKLMAFASLGEVKAIKAHKKDIKSLHDAGFKGEATEHRFQLLEISTEDARQEQQTLRQSVQVVGESESAKRRRMGHGSCVAMGSASQFPPIIPPRPPGALLYGGLVEYAFFCV